MADGFRGNYGGILSLLDELEDAKVRRALTSDLMHAGFLLADMGTEKLPWSHLIAFFRESGEDSALYRTLHPDRFGWTLGNMLLADTVDLLRIMVWQKTRNGRKGRMAPEPIPRPGIEGPKRRRVKGEAIPMDKFKAKLDDLRKRVMRSTSEEVKREVRVKRDGSS